MVSSSNLLINFMILVLVGMPGTAASKTLERGCKGAQMIQYEIDGKKYTHTEPFEYSGTGASKGAVPSPTKARERACEDAAQQAARAANLDRLLNNSDKIPGACRTNCKRAYCGDGVLDDAEGEICDDGNSDPYGGCHQCQRCVLPKDNLAVTSDTRLCSGTHRVSDAAGDGAIRVTGSGVTLDCRGSQLIGTNRQGTGILVTGSNVVLRGCIVSGFGTGIEVRGPNAVIFDNRACDNAVDVKKNADPNFPARNACNKAGSGWIEGGHPGCASLCQ